VEELLHPAFLHPRHARYDMFDAWLPDRIRPDFPAYERLFDGRPLAFLDGPAGSQVPRSVIRAVADYLAYHNANTGGVFPTALETDAMILEARGTMADFLGGAPEEVVFGQNMTTLTYAFSRALARSWKPGDEVVVTLLDHQANVAPWKVAAEERGAVVRVVPFDPDTGTLDYAALESFLNERTRLVAIGYASNALGTINDVHRVVEGARSVGALSFVDAVHYAPHGIIDVRGLGCDFLACSAYKFFGPHVGILWGKREHLESLEPLKVPPAPENAPDRWESGTLSHEGIAGVAAAVKWIAGLAPEPAATRRERVRAGMERIERNEAALMDDLLDGLAAIPGVRIYGPPRGTPRTPTVGFTVEGRSAAEVARRLASEGVCVWSGNFYASSVVEHLGLVEAGGLVRAGLAPYNDREDVRRLLEGVARIAAPARAAVSVG
jgi:cysteine desulfurase family protein (TIGR01976 family)